MPTSKVVGDSTVPFAGANNKSNGLAAMKNQPRQRGGSRKHNVSTNKEGSNSLPRTGAATRTRLNQTAFINQKLMNTDYLMEKFYQVRIESNMI